MIFLEEPISWKDLELKVSSILSGSGYSTEVGKKINTVRGNAAIDVYATKKNEMLLCECKNWTTRVPQTVVHAFRQVIQDSGAHKGFIISRKGFQSGSFETSKNTNIQLLDWNEFQSIFEKDWLREKSKDLWNKTDKLFQYTDILVSNRNFKGLNDEEVEYYWELHKAYQCIWLLVGALAQPFMMSFMDDRDPLEEILKHISFPLILPIPMEDKDIQIKDFSELIDFLEKYNKKGIEDFEKLTRKSEA